MLQRPVGCAAARVVDQDHGGDRGAAEDIKRHQPAGRSSGFENRSYNIWTCAGYAVHVTRFYSLTGAYEMVRVEHSLANDVAALAAAELRCPEMDTAIHTGTKAR